MAKAAFRLTMPARRTSAVVFASPHSGSEYPAEFLAAARLDEQAIRSSEDAFVDRLFACAPEAGAPLIAAEAPRAYVDLNRAAEELDPALIEGLRRVNPNPRIASGLGVIPRVVAGGRPIYHGRIPLAEAEARLANVWHPYHAALGRLVDEAQHSFGQAILIDCHSMPHEALESLGPRGIRKPDVVIGDRFGASAAPGLVAEIEAAFARAGLRCARNMPFAGAYVAQAYGRPARRRHAVQIEIDRALYMDEASIAPRPDFESFRDLIGGVVADIAALGRADPLPMAAE
ncbi:N-formylglutamate amidohydrolase [Pseudoroseicyclus tamaricis]|uniref:N-formylglutamate amidohydrolase n=1 Tax=Pseudoroseicyclus tamaricis TaxID=2705421 RepID=A0A6B2JX82_9RHOB|nr:N-formylglutamate amidohydrolase [Pseudoroseicyclus tamaricis]NDV02740.1 N-formylglutamate amidohydrolase [Pseudoroseicyclus tamaricis]